MWIERSSGSPGGLPLLLCGQNPQQAVAAAEHSAAATTIYEECYGDI